jgi:hypothetical protein
VQDAVIPKRALAELLQLVYDEADTAGLQVVNVFHAGDGNLHPNFLFDSRNPGELEKVENISKRLMQRVVEVGGTLSGEHGIGNDKTDYMPLVFNGDALRLQLSVPAVFCPDHQMNPLKVFAQRRFGSEQSSLLSAPLDAGDSDTRCFEPFIDPIDGIMCISADATSADISRQAKPHRLRFPFILDPQAQLRDQIAASGYAPASSRFGPLCDNIVGMNWELPNGRRVRFGERVVKTTTGYDLFRFLLASGNCFGRPIDYVLRLRNDVGITSVFELAGETSAVQSAAAKLLKNCWMHWFDSVDFIPGDEDDNAQLRICINCPSHEWDVVEIFLSSLATLDGLRLVSHRDVLPPTDGCPDLVLKATPAEIMRLAADVCSLGWRCIGSLAAGVVHVIKHVDDSRDTDGIIKGVHEIVDRHQRTVHQIGGDWHSRHLPPLNPSSAEEKWLEVLTKEFEKS